MDKQIRLENYCLSWYKFYLEYYNFKMLKVISMIITHKKIQRIYAKENEKVLIYYTVKKSTKHKKEREIQKMRNKKPIRLTDKK